MSAGRRGVSSLVGRDDEQGEIGRLIDSARDGLSGVLVVHGEAGIGKTCLLDAAASSVAGVDVVRIVGIESEMRFGFAGLHQLLTPFLKDLDSLPAPQARSLRAAFGMSDDRAPDRFLVGLASLTLLTAAATRRPLLLVVDDAQWLDRESADTLGFLGRRLYADRVCLLVALRGSIEDREVFDGLPALTLAPLSEAVSGDLLDTAIGVPVADHVRARLLAEARGNPLALLEFGRELSPDQLAGAAQLPELLAVDGRLERSFLRQVAALPPATQRLLLVAAAEPTGDPDTIWRAGRDLDFDQDAITAAEEAGLLELGPPVTFRHPLIRSAVYQGASQAERRRAHEALAAASDGARDPDRRVWHRSAAARFPDEDVAAELERAAQRAGSRGSRTVSAALLERAAELTLDRGRRAVRLLGAAVSDLAAGSTPRAQANLARALPDLHDPLLVARARQLEGAIAFIGSFPGARPRPTTQGAVGESVSMMVDAARTLERLDVRLARDAMLDTLPMALYFGMSSGVPIADVARIARSFELPTQEAPTPADLLLDAVAELLAEGYRAATPLLRDALAAVQADPEIRSVPRHLARACYLAFALGDDDALLALATTCATTSREQGVFQGLVEALFNLGLRELRVGSLNGADDCFTEERELQAVLRRRSRANEAATLIVSAWRGRATEVRAEASELLSKARTLGLVVRYTEHARLVLELGLGNDQAASSLARPDWYHELGLGALRAADAAEAHIRSGNRTKAQAAVAYLDERATATQSPLDLGLLSRGQALGAGDADADAETSYRSSIASLDTHGARLHLARSQLVYGEWLRRQKRRRDAREQLEAARDTFEAMGAGGFAERARIELLATGARARRRVDETRDALTPQERQIARLAAGGATNPEIAERLFISAATVDYHLRKVYRKLDITSRHEIRTVASVE